LLVKIYVSSELDPGVPFILSLLMNIIATASAALAIAGCAQACVGASCLQLFRRQERTPRLVASDSPSPPVTILKPLHGDEPLLEAALESFCQQKYPAFQIVFGVQHPDDAAISVVRRLQKRHAGLDIALVIDTTQHGDNRKVGNLINMRHAARHEILVISDSDIHVPPTYLQDVIWSLMRPGVGLATTLYAGLPASNTLVRRLSASQINYNFLPGVLMSRLLGRQDCLGATMALRQTVLDKIGGFRRLVDHVADDSVLGKAVLAAGLTIAIAPCMTWTTSGETSWRELLTHELRWGRTVKNVEPIGYGLSSIQLPLFWAGCAVAFSGFHIVMVWFFLIAWLIRALSALLIDRSLGHASVLPLLLLPVREWLSAGVMVGSARGQKVAWRGQMMHIRPLKEEVSIDSPLEPGD